MKESEEIKRLFAKEDYKAVHFLLTGNEKLQKELEFEYAVATIETSSKTGSINAKIDAIARALKESGFNTRVLEWALLALRDELIVEYELYDRAFFHIRNSEIKGIPTTQRDELALLGYSCLLLYYHIVQSEFEKKGAIILFFLHAFSSVEVYKLISSEKYEKAALFLAQFKYTKESILRIMELTELKCNGLSSVMYIPLLRFYLHILQEKSELFSTGLLEHFRKEGAKCYEKTEQIKKKLNSGEWKEEEEQTQDEYIARLDKAVHDPEFASTLQVIEHPVKTEAAVLKQCKLLEEKKQYNAILDLIEQKYPLDKAKKAPDSVLKFYDRIVNLLYEKSENNSFILRGLKYHKDSEMLKNLLL
jgi:hypothetical protein